MNRLINFQRRLVLSTCIFILLTTGCGRSQDQSWRDKFSAIQWVDYSPSTGNPDQGLEATTDSIRQDLAVLRKAKFSGLVTYGAKGRLGNELLSLAKEAGFRGVIVGVWNPKDSDELSAAQQAAMSDIVLGICIGNEGLMDGRYSLESLANAIRAIRTATKKPVTTTETIDRYDKKLLGIVDWAFPNAHPYFSNVAKPKEAAEWTHKRFQELVKGTSQFVVLKEVGLPTAGDDKQPLSEEAQCEYYIELAKTNTRFVYFEAFDLSWKVKPPVEPHWGIFHSDRSPKPLGRYLAENKPCAIAEAKTARGRFYVYSDNNSRLNHFGPKGLMGDVGDIDIDEDWHDNPKSGQTCIKVQYSARGSDPHCEYPGSCKWAGVYWQEPSGNWGKTNQEEWKHSGYNLQAYKTLKFWARADHPSTVDFKVGGIVGLYGDSLQPARGVTAHLISEWTEFSIDLTEADLHYIIGGFAWAANKKLNPNGATFYLDDIRFESQ